MHGPSLLAFTPNLISKLVIKKGQAALVLSLLRTKRVVSEQKGLSNNTQHRRTTLITKLRKLKTTSYDVEDTQFTRASFLTDNELAYIAGFLDGDGSLQLQRQTQTLYYSVQFSFFNNNPKVLVWIGERIGGKLVKQKMRKTDKTQPYALRVRLQDLKSLIPQITPCLLVKKVLAQCLSNFWEAQTKDEQLIIYNQFRDEMSKPQRVNEELLQNSIYLTDAYKYEERYARGKGTEFA